MTSRCTGVVKSVTVCLREDSASWPFQLETVEIVPQIYWLPLSSR